MAWYYILFFSVLCFLIIKSLFSQVMGEIEVDMDFDGEGDMNFSDILSFKGMLHFLLGFSSVLSATSFGNTRSLTESYELSWWVYLIAVLVGVVLVIGLYYLYKVMLKLNHYNTDNPNFNNMRGSIYGIWPKEDYYPFRKYQVLVNTYQGTHKIIAYSTHDLKIGEEVTVILNEEKNQYEIY